MASDKQTRPTETPSGTPDVFTRHREPDTVLAAYYAGVTRLQAAKVANAKNEAFWLLETALGISRLKVYADPETLVSSEEWERADAMFRRRAFGEPLQYIVGTQFFRGRALTVNSSVLIPRRESELIVDAVVASPFSGDRCHVVDVGTGSGCLAVSLALERPGVSVYATDCSHAALRLAKENARRHGVADRITFLQGDGLEPVSDHGLAGNVSVIVSNPPYIPSDQFDLLPREVRAFEPRLALDGGRRGLKFYDRLLTESPALLHAGGLLILEMGASQSGDVANDARRRKAFSIKFIRPDQAGIDRVICLERI